MLVRRSALAAMAACDAALLVLLRPRFGQLAHHLAAPHAWLRHAGADAALASVAGAALWLTAAWFALGLLAAGAARLPGALGRWSAASGAALLPRAVHRFVAGSIGLSIVVVPVAANATPAHLPAPATATASCDRVSISTRVPAPAWPGTAEPETVRVRPGDSLWLLAAHHLGPRATSARIAAEWPRWWAANRAVIGTDPSVIRPGQLLVVPAPTAHDGEAHR